jgi:hypothetical protein
VIAAEVRIKGFRNGGPFALPQEKRLFSLSDTFTSSV